MDGVILTPLKQISNSQGDVFHAMKKSDDGYDGFGEAYFSTINKYEVKGWKKHTMMTLNLIVPLGEIKFVVYNEAKNFFFSVNLSQDNYQRLTIKPKLWLAFKGLENNNVLLNIASIEHDLNEFESKVLHDIEYEW